MNSAELRRRLNESVLVVKDLGDRLKAIRARDIPRGTDAYRIWKDEEMFLRKEWIKACDEYLAAFKAFIDDERNQ